MLPVDDIERLGSFDYHMSRSVLLGMRVVAQNRALRPALDLAVGLARRPDKGK